MEWTLKEIQNNKIIDLTPEEERKMRIGAPSGSVLMSPMSLLWYILYCLERRFRQVLNHTEFSSTASIGALIL